MELNHLRKQAHKLKSHHKRPDKFIEFKDIQKLGKKLHAQNKKIVFTTGSFDLLNPGHCRYLAEAKANGDILVVGVSTNVSDAYLKGPDFPLISEDIRAELISYLRTVDYVTLIEEFRPHAILSLLQPDVFFTNEDSWKDGTRDPQEAYIVKSYGGSIVVRPPHMPYYGTSLLIDHMANIRVMQILESYLREKITDFYLDPEKNLKPAEYGDQSPREKTAFNSAKLIIEHNNLEELGNTLRKKKKTVAFVAGSFDLLHTGHARFIEQAGILADVLVVGIPSDASLRTLKGIGRPMINQQARAYVLGHLDPVDYVTIFDDATIYNSLKALKPDIFFTVAESWNNGYKKSAEYRLVKKYGGDVVVSERQSPFLSSSAIIDRMAHHKVMEIFKECMNEERYIKILSEKSKIVKKGDNSR